MSEIINQYKPHKGFFDLSKQPSTLNEEEYAKILSIQDYLALENEKMNDMHVRKANKSHWDNLKLLSAELQGIIIQHWNLCDLN